MFNLLKYHTFVPYEDKEKTLQLKDLLYKIYLSDDPLHENYSLERFDLDNQIAVTFGLLENEIVLLSTLYKRPSYKKNIARTMNRVWKHKNIRANTFGKFLKNSDITSLSIVPIHIKYALKNNIDSIFISIEGGAYRYLKFLSKKLSDVTNYNWCALENKIDVVGTNNLQHITYCHLNPILASQSSKQQHIFTVI